jgi:hypothetical protein
MVETRWSAIGWLAWYDEAGTTVRYDSRDGWRWAQLPETRWLAFRVIWDERWKAGNRYSDLYVGEWLIHEVIDGKDRWRITWDVADPGGDRRQGLNIDNTRWELLRRTFADPEEAKR